MSDYKIITDSNCDFTPALIEELDIQVIPMEFVMGEKVYRNYPDERDMCQRVLQPHPQRRKLHHQSDQYGNFH